jgi:hypothetical protein
MDNGGDALAGLSFFDAGRVSFGSKTKKAPESVSAVALLKAWV